MTKMLIKKNNKPYVFLQQEPAWKVFIRKFKNPDTLNLLF